MSTTIQINSLEALERLIGNDTELEFQLRSSIVQDFTKKHLKALATDELLAKTAKAVNAEISKEFFTEVGNGWQTKVLFKPAIIKELKETLEFTARQQLLDAVSEVVEEEKTLTKINKALDNAVDFIVNRLTEQVLTDKLERLVDTRLKEKLGIQ